MSRLRREKLVTLLVSEREASLIVSNQSRAMVDLVDNGNTMVLYAVKCWSCGEPVAAQVPKYLELISSGATEKEALDQISYLPCTRVHFLRPSYYPRDQVDMSAVAGHDNISLIRPEKNSLGYCVSEENIVQGSLESKQIYGSRKLIDLKQYDPVNADPRRVGVKDVRAEVRALMNKPDEDFTKVGMPIASVDPDRDIREREVCAGNTMVRIGVKNDVVPVIRFVNTSRHLCM